MHTTSRNFADLSAEEKNLVRRHFHAACIHRAQQWDEEAAIEQILGHEINVDFSEWAAIIDTDDSPEEISIFNDEDIAGAIDDDADEKTAPHCTTCTDGSCAFCQEEIRQRSA